MVPSKSTSKIGNEKKTAKKETKKIKKIINEEVRLGLHDSSSEADDVDLTKEMFPLRHYVNDRKEMIDQMFSVIYGSKLKKMLPPVLKDMPVEELKAECLIHLLGMSSKRILSILDGKELDSSSESDTHSEKSASHESPPLTNNTKMKKGIIKQEGCSDISDDTADVDRDLDMLEIGINKKEMGDIMGELWSLQKFGKQGSWLSVIKIMQAISEQVLVNSHVGPRGPYDCLHCCWLTYCHRTNNTLQHYNFPASSQNKHINQKKRKLDEMNVKKCKVPVKSKSPSRKLEGKGFYSNSNGESDENDQEKNRSSDKEKNNENVDTKQGRTLLEILELEMRARAIRALLKQDDLPEEGDATDKNSNKKVDEKDALITDTQKVAEKCKKKKRNYRNRSLESYDSDMKSVLDNAELVTIDLTNESDTKLNKTSLANKNQDEISLKSNEGDNKSIGHKHSSEITNLSGLDSKKNIEMKSSEYKESVTDTNLGNHYKLDYKDSERSKTESKSSWAERWLQSKDVKKVVTTSKMCANIRKRMKNARLAKQLQNSDQTKPALNLEGSVSEYRLIKAGNSANEKSEESSVINDQQQTDSSSCHKQESSSVSKEITNLRESVNSQCVDQLEINSDQTEIELELAPTENELNIDSVGVDVNINDNIKNKE